MYRRGALGFLTYGERGRCTVVEHLSRHSKVKGLSLAVVVGSGGENVKTTIIFGVKQTR